jgi:hypothetical protein
MPPNGSAHNLRGPPKGLSREDTATAPGSKKDSRGSSATGPDARPKLSRRPVCFRGLIACALKLLTILNAMVRDQSEWKTMAA